MTSLDRLPQAMRSSPPDPHDAVARLRAGEAFACVLEDDTDRRAALLHSVLATAAEDGTRIARVGNPLRAKLTIERLLIQVVGPEADLRLERDAPSLARLLAQPVADETRLIVVVEQPETLDPEALRTLHRMAPSFAEVTPRVQLLFCGPQAFAAALDQDAPASPPPPAALPPAAIVAPEAAMAAPVHAAPGSLRQPTSGRRWTLSLVGLAALAGVAAVAWQNPHVIERLRALRPAPRLEAPFPAPAAPAPAVARPAPATPGIPASAALAPAAQPVPPAVTAPPAPVAPPVAEPVPASVMSPNGASDSAASPGPAQTPAPGIDDAQLRREFDQFLAQRGPDAARLSPTQREALLQEFRAWRHGKDAVP